MANTCTKIDQFQASLPGCDKIIAYSVSIDTTGTDLTIHTPATDRRVLLCGQFLSEGTAANVSFISQSPNLTGTIATSSASTSVTGTGTTFTSDFLSGGPPFVLVGSAGVSIAVSSVASATSLTLASGSGFTSSGQTYKRRLTLVIPELAANQGIYHEIRKGFIVATWPGDSLIVRSSAAITNWLLYVCEAPASFRL